jgi:hypothetical protein
MALHRAIGWVYAASLLGLVACPSLVRGEPPPSAKDRVSGRLPGARRARPANLESQRPHGRPARRIGELTFSVERDKSLLYRDPAGRFSMRISPDGEVLFADRWRRTSARKPTRGRCCAAPPEGFSRGTQAVWGLQVPGPLEAAVRIHDGDQNVAGKAELLRMTADFRRDLRRKWQHDQVRRELVRLQRSLEAIWGDERLALGRRKELLFRLWDECDTRTSVAWRRAAARRAQALIVAFIREHAPARTPTGYGDNELRRLNRSRAHSTPFSPYVDLGVPHDPNRASGEK